MKIFRSIEIFFVLFFLGFGALILGYIIFPVISIIFKENKKYELCSFILYKVWNFYLKFLSAIGFMRTDTDIEKLCSIKNKIIVSTHPTLADVFIYMALIPKTTCFVKKELFKNPFLSKVLSCLFISNDLELDELKQEAKKMLDKGFNIIIFPTGSRHGNNEHPKVKKGASMLALYTNTNIVPIKMYTNEEFLFINRPFWEVGDRTTIFSINIQDEINIDDFDKDNEIIAKREITKMIDNRLYK